MPTRPPDKPAAGLGALTSTARHLSHEKALRPGLKALRRINQVDGFDCPGCAWPEALDRSHFEFCENGAKAVAAETTGKRVTSKFFADHSVSDLLERSDYWLEQQGRLTSPVIRRAGSDHYEPISWDDAFAHAARLLRELDSPDEAAFYTSGRTSNEAAFLYQLFGRMFGTNNFPDCSNLCHESSGVGLTRSIGLGKGAVQLSDFERADAIFIIGQNPGTNHPRMLSTLLAARRRGAEIVSINPLRERGLERFTDPKEALPTLLGRGTQLSTVYLQPKVGSDVAVLKGIMKLVLEADDRARGEVLDREFILNHTVGFDALAADLHATDWNAIEEQSGLARADFEAAADVYIRARATIVCWAMGLTQHENAVDNVIACSNLLLLKGNIGRPGAGPCPVRGHSNVQGDRTVGITHQPSPAFVDGLRRAFNFEPPAEAGMDVVETIHAMHDGRIRFFMSMGGNFHSASPDTDYTAEALRKTDLCVHVATKLNRSHLVTGSEAMIWPCLGRTEVDLQQTGPQSVTVEDSMSCVHASSGRKSPASPHLLSEPAIVAGLAKATLPEGGKVDWDALIANYDVIRERIEDVLPIFADFNKRVRQPGGFVLRHPAAHREWNTASGKAEFGVVPMPSIRLSSDQLRMFTIRSHDQFNTTIYGMDDRYRGITERRVVLLHPDDIATRGIGPGDIVDLVGAGDDGRVRVARAFRVVAYDVPQGCAATYFPEANVLVPIGSTARGSNTPSSKMVPVTLRPSE
ncbi:MAG TPA: FdhF/YdeP family oxidoreductase [Longimicrobiaceae bacterium]|nr:FdhF/YdeP family oxidoreductase [Longimicrobiaceae bacterium]